jgi:hypothetical protein
MYLNIFVFIIIMSIQRSQLNDLYYLLDMYQGFYSTNQQQINSLTSILSRSQELLPRMSSPLYNQLNRINLQPAHNENLQRLYTQMSQLYNIENDIMRQIGVITQHILNLLTNNIDVQTNPPTPTHTVPPTNQTNNNSANRTRDYGFNVLNGSNSILRSLQSAGNTTNQTTRINSSYQPVLIDLITFTSPDVSGNRLYTYNIPANFYDAVPILPTPETIRLSTRQDIFSNFESPINTNCPITLEQFLPNTPVTQIIGCGHIFTTDRLNRWFRANTRCPVCRYDIRSRNSNHVNEDLVNNAANEDIPDEDHADDDDDDDEDERNGDDTLENIQQDEQSYIPTYTNNIYGTNQHSTNLSPDFLNNLSALTENLLIDALRSQFNITTQSYQNTHVDTSNNNIT